MKAMGRELLGHSCQGPSGRKKGTHEQFNHHVRGGKGRPNPPDLENHLGKKVGKRQRRGGGLKKNHGLSNASFWFFTRGREERCTGGAKVGVPWFKNRSPKKKKKKKKKR